MQVQRTDSDDKPAQKERFTHVDLYKFESPNKYSSLGKLGLSTIESAPVYGFGTSTRQKQGKVYQSEELSKTQFIGKTSPGPKYEVRDTDKYSYKQDPSWTMGKQVRETLGMGQKHAYYTRRDVDFDPATSDATRRPHAPIVKIGLESRFPNEKKQKGTPGPEYDPKIKPEVPNSPQYSFGVRREIQGQSALILPSSTPKQVGPGSYSKPDQMNTSNLSDQPKWSFTKDPKHRSHNNDSQKNQTFDTRSSMGGQVSSKNKSGSQVSFGKAKKDYQTGIFKDMMATQATSVRIAMPRF